jgi:hypothetical protein
VLLARTKDTTYYTAPVLLASIVEFNVGIIVGCMPVIQPAIASRFVKACQLSSVRSLIFRLSFKSKLSKESPGNSDQYRDDKRYGQPYLKTEILHGADGDGRFMSTIGTKSGTRRSWFRRSIMGTRRNNGSMNTMLYSTTAALTTNNDPTHHRHQESSNENILVMTRVSSDCHTSQERECEIL